MTILTTIVHKRKMSLKLKVRPFWISKILKSQNDIFSDKYPYAWKDAHARAHTHTHSYIDDAFVCGSSGQGEYSMVWINGTEIA